MKKHKVGKVFVFSLVMVLIFSVMVVPVSALGPSQSGAGVAIREPSEPPTEPPSEPPTEPPSEPPTEPPTEPPAEPPSEPPSRPPSEPSSPFPTPEFPIQITPEILPELPPSPPPQVTPPRMSPPQSELSPEPITADFVEQDILVREHLPRNNIPLVQFGNNSIMLFAPADMESWALINLILVVLGLALASVVIIRTLDDKRKEKKTEIFDADLKDEKNDKKRHYFIWVAAALAMGFAGILLFILTQDITKIVVLLDWWSIAHVAFTAVQILATRLVFKHTKHTKQTEKAK